MDTHGNAISHKVKSSWKTCRQWWKDTNKPSVTEWLILGAIYLICLSTIAYGDLTETSNHSLLFLDKLFQGEFFDFYRASLTETFFPAVYDVPVYLLLAVWNFPIWIFTKFGFVYLDTPFLIAWSGAICVLFALGTAYAIHKFCLEVKMDRSMAKWAAFLFLASMNVILSVGIVGQIEIISCFFTVMGLLKYVQKDRKGFLLYFILAISMKLFAILVFVPLLLYREKKVLKIVFYGLTGTSLVILSKLPFLGNEGYQIATSSLGNTIVTRISNATIVGINEHGFSIFVTLFVLVCVWAYMKKEEDDAGWAVYFPLCAYAAFFCFVPSHPYWIVLASPFLILTMFQNPTRFKANVLVQLVLNASFLLASMISYRHVFAAEWLEPMFLSGLSRFEELKDRKFIDWYAILDRFRIPDYKELVAGVFIAAFVAVVAFNRPKPSGTKSRFRIQRSVVWVHFTIPIVVLIGVFLCGFVRGNPVALSTMEHKNVEQAVYLESDEDVYEQQVSFKKDFVLQEIRLVFRDVASHFRNKGIVIVQLVDEEGMVLATDQRPFNRIRNLENERFDLNRAKVEEGRTYRIRIRSKYADSAFRAGLVMTKEGTLNDVYFKGKEGTLNYNLAFEITAQK